MKKIAIALLLSVPCFYFISSCKKFCVPHERTCQIRSIQYNYLDKQTTLTYTYNNKRLLTTITGNASVNPVTPAVINITYNNQDKPVTGNNYQNVPYKLIYDNGRVVRIDYLGTDNMYHLQYTYVYDSLGRITNRISADESTLRFEYTGTSRNYTRMLELYHIRPGFPVEVFAVHTYEYDDKINPWSTWPNTTLNPFYFDLVRGGIWEYLLIPENNITHYTIEPTFRGIPLKSDEFFYTYQYDGDYPARQDFLRLVFNPFIPGSVDSTRGVNYYNYDCIGGSGGDRR